MNIFELMPKTHFGDVGEKVRSNLQKGESLLVYGVYGSGIQYFMRYCEHELKVNNTVLFFRGGIIQDKPELAITKEINNITKLSNLESSLNTFSNNNRLYILIDSFQQIKDTSKLLQFLAVLRKSNPNNIVIMIGIDHSFITTLQDVFNKNDAAFSYIYRLEPFDLEGTKRIININNKLFEWQIPLNKSEAIYSLTGGNPKLIRYVCRIITIEGINVLDNINLLTNHILLEPKLNQFIDLLLQLDKKQLQQLSIINNNDQLFCNLLVHKIKSFEIPYLEDLMPELNGKERKVFSYLLLNKGKLVSTQKLDFMLNLIGESYSLWASYKAINRLRKKIENKFNLKNIKGKGYLLEDFIQN